MNKKLHVLHLENDANDAGLVKATLESGGIDSEVKLVHSGEEFIENLNRSVYDVILADYKLPDYDGLSALKLIREQFAEIPFIFVSGTMGEDAAIQALTQGANDYVLKRNLSRLVPAILRAVETTRQRDKKRKLDHKLHSMEKKLADIFQNSAESIISIDERHEIILINKAAEHTFGYTSQEVLGKPMDILIPDRLALLHRKLVEKFAALPETSRQIKHRHSLVAKRKDGSEFPVEIGLSKLMTDEGVIFTAMILDITERKQAEKKLLEANALLDKSQEIAHVGSWEYDLDSSQLICSDEVYRIFGMRPQEFAGTYEAFLEAIHPEDKEAVNNAYSRSLSAGAEGFEIKHRIFHRKTGEVRIIHEKCEHIQDVSGRIIRSIGMVQDITERTRAEEKIQQQVEQLTTLREVYQLIATTFDVNMSMRVLLSHAIKLLAVDATALLLLNPVLGVLEYSVGIGFRTNAIQNTSVRLGKSLAGNVALERHIIQIQNLMDEKINPFSSNYFKGEEFVSYVGTPLIVKGKLIGVLELFSRSFAERDKDWLDFFNILAGQAAIMIDDAQLFNDLQVSNVKLSLAYDETIEGWSHALDLRDKETEGHTQRVTDLTIKLARQVGFPNEELVHIRRGALLHDIGKLGVPDHILLKSGALSEIEWEIMRKHPSFAYELLVPIRYLKSAAIDIPYCHHEKWDGSGYPRGLKGEEIPLSARIFAVVDVWDAITSDRCYRPAWTKEKALDYLQEQSEKHFDPRVVKMFLKMIE